MLPSGEVSLVVPRSFFYIYIYACIYIYIYACIYIYNFSLVILVLQPFCKVASHYTAGRGDRPA